MIALGKVVILMFNIYLVLLPGAGDVVFFVFIYDRKFPYLFFFFFTDLCNAVVGRLRFKKYQNHDLNVM